MNKLAKKVSQRLGPLCRARSHLNTIYKAFISLVLDYCDICWSSVGSTLTEKLERFQKRAAMVVPREGASKDPLSRAQLGWANLRSGRQQHLGTFIFKYWRAGSDLYLQIFLTLHSRSDNHDYKIRSNWVLYFQLWELSLGKKKKFAPESKDLQRARLPDSAKRCKSLPQFKNMLRIVSVILLYGTFSNICHFMFGCILM